MDLGNTVLVYFDPPSGGGGGGGCILSGTEVLLPDLSVKEVDRLKLGDLGMGYNSSRGRLEPVKVARITSTHVRQAISLNDGLPSATTTDQPRSVRNDTWVDWARNPYGLRVGEELFQPVSQTWINITWIEILTGNYKVWDLATEPLNNFMANSILADSKLPSRGDPMRGVSRSRPWFPDESRCTPHGLGFAAGVG